VTADQVPISASPSAPSSISHAADIDLDEMFQRLTLKLTPMSSVTKVGPPSQNEEPQQPKDEAPSKKPESKTGSKELAVSEVEKQYLAKTVELLLAHPKYIKISANVIYDVVVGLTVAYSSSITEKEKVGRLKKRCVFGFVQHLKKTQKGSLKPVSASLVNSLLQESHGNLFTVLAELIEMDLIEMADLSGLSKLCEAIHNALPQNKPLVELIVDTNESGVGQLVVVDPLEGAQTGLQQEKQEARKSMGYSEHMI
jgi:hypothetical protein